jgi:hypothetical protein
MGGQLVDPSRSLDFQSNYTNGIDHHDRAIQIACSGADFEDLSINHGMG